MKTADRAGESKDPAASAAVMEITVSDPVKQGDGMKSYVSYKVNTYTNLPGFKTDRFYSVRRYSDFLWLQQQLDREYAGLIIPPLPEKALMGNFSRDFVSARQRSLEKFLVRMAVHPVLREANIFRGFLEAGESEWQGVRDQVNEANKKSRRGFVEWMSDTATSVSNKFGSSDTGPQSAEDLAFEEISKYIESLEPQLQMLIKHASGLVRNRKELATGTFEFGLAFSQLGQSESSILGLALGRVGKTADTLSGEVNALAEKEFVNFLEPIRDYIRVIASVKNALGHRQAKRVELKNAMGAFESKRMATMKVTGVAGRERQREIAQAEQDEAKRVADKVQAEYDQVARRVLVEIERFKREKMLDFRQIVLKYVQLQIDYNRRVEEAWTGILPELEAAHISQVSKAAEIEGRTAPVAIPVSTGGGGGGGSGGGTPSTPVMTPTTPGTPGMAPAATPGTPTPAAPPVAPS